MRLLYLVLSLLLSCAWSVFAVKNPKRGLAYAEADRPTDIAVANQSASVLSWVYDWGTTARPFITSSHLQYIPMQWGAGGIETFASTVIAQGAKTILAFNEPDFASESNIPATQAATLWMKYIQALHNRGVKLGAPAVTNAPSGAPWLAAFLAACTNCTIDFIPLHWYGDDLGPFYDYIWSMHGQFPNYPIWVTEYASTSLDDAVVLDFLKQSEAYLDSLDWIQAYSWFAFFRKETGSNYNLLDINGQLSPLGQAYVNNAV
ncbi:hypothetical protein B0H19DRAFT_1373530 [Mycena capillaripes]|nr:hypothetical protein B0H19DRAFT_1373530 [Mycena capillaripes]